jgi:uncharacterized membrane protein
MGSIGSIMLLIPALNIIGIVLVFLGIRGLAKQYKDNSLYHNAAIGTFFGIFGLFIITNNALVLLINYIFTSKTTLVISNAITVTQQTPSLISFDIIAFGILIMFSPILLMALFYRSAFSALAGSSGKHLFRPAGNLLLIGAIIPLLCTIIAVLTSPMSLNVSQALTIWGLFSGLFVVYIAFIIMVIAFSSLKQTQTYRN